MQSPAILFLPIIDWELRRQRPQQLARCFARAGCRVYYPDLRLQPEATPPRHVESGIWRIALRGEDRLDPYRDRLSPADVQVAAESLRLLSAAHPLDGCWIVAQLPFWRPLALTARELFGGRLLFDCMDDFSAFADHGDQGAEEVALAEGADLVAVTARRLYEKLAPHNPRTVIVPNGCDPEHFAAAAARAPRRGRPVVGFFGGIHEWFDGPLVEAVARRHPEWEVWLIGDTYGADVDMLRGLPNVFLLGELPYAELPRLVSHFDVGIIPFRITPLTEATNPVKVYEMLAAGLPVVATEPPELREMAALVRLATTAEGFSAGIEEALTESPEAREQRRVFARQQSWTERFLALWSAMQAVPFSHARAPETGTSPPSLLSLDLTESAWDRPDLLRRIDQLRAEIAALERERGQHVEQRRSLMEQRDRVQREAERLGGELVRVEGERIALETARGALETELRRITAGRWWRLGLRLRSLFSR